MKRPAGFDPAATPARGPRSAPAGGTSKSSPPSRTSPASAAGNAPRADRSSHDDASTEPITLPPLPPQPSAADRPAADRPGSSTVEPPNAAAPSTTTTGTIKTGSIKTGTTKGSPKKPAAADKPLTTREARKRHRAARRARKQYERSEVRRFTSRSRRRRNTWIGAIVTVAALAAFVLVGVFSPLMALRTIEVTGTDRIPAEDVVQALDGQIGTPLPLLDLTQVKQELSEFSLIRSFVTESRPPDTLVVRIIEREPVGSIASAAGFDLVDAAGVVISSGAERTADYPVIDAAGGASGAGFQAAVAVVRALPTATREQLDTITAATKDDVTLTLAGGARIVWGNAERSDYKAVVLGALIVSHPVGSVTEYDVSSPDSAVVR